MAWVTEYDLKWAVPNTSGMEGSIYIQRDDVSYVGSLTLQAGSLEIRNGLGSWDDPIARMNCSFTIVNDLPDFYTLIPLMTAALGAVRVVVTNDAITSDPVHIFEGFLNCETVNQTMLNRSPITLTASGYIGKLQNEHPASVDTLDYNSIINTICDCISLTGSTDPVHVNISLYENNSAPGAGQTVFNRIDTYQEVWWTNNVERMSALDILKSILSSFDCYLYWHNQGWYIRHYQDLGDLTPAYVTYDPTSSAGYGFADSGTGWSDLLVALDVHNQTEFRQIGDTQTLSVVPGLRQLDLRLDLKKYWNLFYPDLTDTYESSDPTPALQARRQWWAYDNVTSMTWATVQYPWGISWRNIETAGYRVGDDLTIVGGIATAGWSYGMSTRFNLTAQEDTMLNLKWKFGISNPTALYAIGLLEDITIRFHYYVCLYDSVEGNRDYLVYSNDSDDEWTISVDGDPETDINYIDITGADLDSALWTYEASVDIPIGGISGILSSSGDPGHLDLIFGLGTEVCSQAGENDKAANSCFYGDIVATVAEDPANNFIEGVTATDFIEKKEITMHLCDAGWSYRNSLFYYVNQYYSTLAEDWTYDGATLQLLEDWLMSTKFRLNRISRQKIEMDVYTIAVPIFELFWPFYDSKQSNLPFALTGVTVRPESNTMKVTLQEYDDTEPVNLI